MSARELITEHLDLWTGAVAKKSSSGRGSNGKVELTGIKKLRELILELAVRGKLVDQIQEDEPSSELLKKIAAEKNKRIERGEIKKPKKLPAIDDAELSFQIPASWKFIRLGDAVDIIRGITFPASEKSKSPAPGRLTCLRTTNVQDTIEVDDLLFIKESFVTKNSQYIQKNDIVMSMANSRELVGKVAFVEEQPDEPMTFGGFLGVLRPTLIHPKFLMAVLRAPHSRATLIGNASQTTNIANISIGKLNPLVIGLPPIEEQHRIVQKVDELMALCDRLERQTSDQLEAHETLVDTLLGTLTQSENATELADNWARFAAHFDTLLTTGQSIDKLKQTILQLAVMGRLVEQDAGDEPANMLLTKIEDKKMSLYHAGTVKKPKHLPLITEDEQHVSLPAGWAWARFGQTGYTRLGKMLDKAKNSGTVKPYLRNTNVQWWRIDVEDIKTFRLENHELKEYELEDGDLLICEGGEPGRCAVWRHTDMEMYFQKAIHRHRTLDLCSPDYLKICLTVDFDNGRLGARFTGATIKHLPGDKLMAHLCPIPPLEEQHRIVQKVDELIALCDQLKGRLNQAGETRCQLAESVIEKSLI